MWYVIQTVNGQEEKVLSLCAGAVARFSYAELFIPRYIARKKYSGKWQEKKEVLFPGYFMADIEDVEKFQAQIGRLHGEPVRLVRTGDDVVPVSPMEQARLERIMDKEHVVAFSKGYIVDGKTVVTCGPLSGLEDRIVRIDRHRQTAEIRLRDPDRDIPAKAGLEIIAKVAGNELPCIRILSGVFAGMQGRLLGYSEKKREATVLADMFSGQTPITLPIEEVEKI